MGSQGTAIVGLILLSLLGAWVLDVWLDGRERRRRCPVCQGASERRAYRENGFMDWCDMHRGAWFNVTSIWDTDI